ncbi:PREDICTED: uncharacterized protein LOC104815137 [Tarenaya hassleriana]|uniref:uncharacterized protein LOC104815137 n=1 Tax=Tarenaya hassleriana TaxID=28532 RepID=UPI00053C28E9|nr:PREDICTED: uncharacterized protein LOC104815137 [Tarenaya hassleriana]
MVQFIPEMLQASSKEWDDFIIGQFYGRSPTMNKIIGVVNAIWARGGARIRVHNMGKGTFLFKIPNARLKSSILMRNFWYIGDCPMFISAWNPNHRPEKPALHSVPTWVTLTNVSEKLFDSDSLSRIATCVGEPLYLHPLTEAKEVFNFAKIYVEVSLAKPPPKSIAITLPGEEERFISVAYEWLPPSCDHCLEVGHNVKHCPNIPTSEVGNQQKKNRPQWKKKKARSGEESKPVMGNMNGPETGSRNQEDCEGRGNCLIEKVAETNVDSSPGKEESSVAQNLATVATPSPVGGKPTQPEHSSEMVGQSTNSVATIRTNPPVTIPTNPTNSQRGKGIKEPDDGYTLVSCQSITCGVFIPSLQLTLAATFIYAKNTALERREVWAELTELSRHHMIKDCAWVILGDFNQMLHHNERSDQHVATSSQGMDDLRSCIEETRLFDMPYRGLQFTWWNNHQLDPVAIKLDRVLINDYWFERFPAAFTEFMTPGPSDHAPSKIHFPGISTQVQKSFKFFPHIALHPNFLQVVQESWKYDSLEGNKQERLKQALKGLKKPLRGLNN